MLPSSKGKDTILSKLRYGLGIHWEYKNVFLITWVGSYNWLKRRPVKSKDVGSIPTQLAKFLL